MIGTAVSFVNRHDAIRKVLGATGLDSVWNEVTRSSGMDTGALHSVETDKTRLVQVAGVPRSGTTLMAMMIENHPHARCLSEPYLSWMKRGYFKYLDTTEPGHTKEVFEKRRPHKVMAEFCLRPSLRVVAFKETFRTPDHPTFPSQAFLKANHRRGAVQHTLAIVRDPRDVWASIINRHPHFEGNIVALHELTAAWNELCDWIHQNDLPHVRYEDLATDPSRLEPLLDRIGLPSHSDIYSISGSSGYGDKRAQGGGSVDTSSVGRHKNALSVSVRRAIVGRCEAYIDDFGYL